jgi:hypothetical protein
MLCHQLLFNPSLLVRLVTMSLIMFALFNCSGSDDQASDPMFGVEASSNAGLNPLYDDRSGDQSVKTPSPFEVDKLSKPKRPAYPPCGGEIAGSWRMASIRLAAVDEGGEADECTASIFTTRVQDGPITTFRSDGTFSMSPTPDAKSLQFISAECEIASYACTAMAGKAKSKGGTCSLNTSGCHCEYRYESNYDYEEDGKWSVSGSKLNTMGVSRIIGKKRSYCVQKDTLAIHAYIGDNPFVTTTYRRVAAVN